MDDDVVVDVDVGVGVVGVVDVVDVGLLRCDKCGDNYRS